MTPAAKISSDTWRRLSLAQSLGSRFGEETITDLLVLEMLQYQRSNAFRVFHPNKILESKWGADLLVWILRRSGGSRFLAIQAKKLYPSGRYEALNHRSSSGVRQIDLLEDFACQFNAIPLYLLYNYPDSQERRSYWHCCKPVVPEQLGCTLVPIWKIDYVIKTHGKRTFEAVHDNRTSLPWRCIFDCCQSEELIKKLVLNKQVIKDLQSLVFDSTLAGASGWYPEILPFGLGDLQHQKTGSLSADFLDTLRMQIGRFSESAGQGESRVGDGRLYPPRLLIVDYRTDEASLYEG